MRGPRLFDHTDWKRKKGLHVLRCPVFTESIGIVKSKKGIAYRYSFLDVLFSTKSISEEKKKSSLFVMRLPIFFEALGFSLYVNPALCLQSIFSLSTCDMSNLCGL